ncbi:hypothetical protein EIMP300_12110 [Escherichia coli]|uniref:Selenocysteinyl-tRNA-specific translation factor n=1 Tax=Escherichia coli TaxID=562 RepID=A0A8S0FG03_ECOLX|nr:hypothetical protein EIMP300_12110 [Escherichia coli]
MIVELQTHTPLTQWQPLHIHHAASHVTGRVSLLEDNLAELVFDTPLWLADNDRIVLRDISARNTLAGARVVMLNPPRRGKRKPEYLQWLASLARAQSDADALSVHLERGAVNLVGFRLGTAAQRRRDARTAATAWLYSGWLQLVECASCRPLAAENSRHISDLS